MSFTEPTPADLKARYPAFANVADATAQVYLNDTAGDVDQSWQETDYIPAKCAMAAHLMALAGLGDIPEADVFAAQGLTRIRSGQFDISISEARAEAASAGGLDATSYGRAYKRLLYRNKRGARVVPAGARCPGWGPTAQTNSGGVLPWDC